ncbi:hypothetical protein DH2020_026543 [Rehmannia glutinosa]|uniref:ethanolamine-phosphate cytidylyltransferase n=1 Tax=Rehmannia glutinosa TaxID=99300 RepID=A0ABR0VWM1_REHGL
MPHLFPDLRVFHKKKSTKKRVRVYMDGCFDLMHYGHANALRQAKALGDELVVGVVSDEEIISNKGPPVLSMQERLALVSGLKWVDEVIPNAPYEITEEFMNRLFKEHKIDYIIHGDDPCLLPDGTDAYALAKKVGRYKQIKRTEGVSSTDIVGTGPGPNSRVVYIDGAFDLFTLGTWSAKTNLKFGPEIYHYVACPSFDKEFCLEFSSLKSKIHINIVILKSARQLGDFLLVGIYADQTVSELRGGHFPLMNLHERSLSVLACRYVDEVIIGAPWEVTNDMITTFNISLVVHGTVAENNPFLNGKSDPYVVPKNMGIFQTLESPKDITTTSIARRIIVNHEIYVKRNAKKEASEKKYYAEKKYVSD